ncbi:MAG: hypothetical protein AABX37_00920, partial [Nanoarchaeota archaeon]
ILRMLGLNAKIYKNRKYCIMCGEDVPINYIEMSYAFKLLLDEFRSLGVYSQLNLVNKYQ